MSATRTRSETSVEAFLCDNGSGCSNIAPKESTYIVGATKNSTRFRISYQALYGKVTNRPYFVQVIIFLALYTNSLAGALRTKVLHNQTPKNFSFPCSEISLSPKRLGCQLIPERGERWQAARPVHSHGEPIGQCPTPFK